MSSEIFQTTNTSKKNHFFKTQIVLHIVHCAVDGEGVTSLKTSFSTGTTLQIGQGYSGSTGDPWNTQIYQALHDSEINL